MRANFNEAFTQSLFSIEKKREEDDDKRIISIGGSYKVSQKYVAKSQQNDKLFNFLVLSYKYSFNLDFLNICLLNNSREEFK